MTVSYSYQISTDLVVWIQEQLHQKHKYQNQSLIQHEANVEMDFFQKGVFLTTALLLHGTGEQSDCLFLLPREKKTEKLCFVDGSLTAIETEQIIENRTSVVSSKEIDIVSN